MFTFLKEKGLNASEPSYVLTRLGPIASGGRVEMGLDSRQIFEARVSVVCGVRESKQLRQEITKLKATLNLRTRRPSSSGVRSLHALW